ncbi:MAG: hypothetical protein U5L08_07605 [Xanthomonadales bacterium]|nr:hypothetical protein [Xanthomonadales bacterium]
MNQKTNHANYTSLSARPTQVTAILRHQLEMLWEKPEHAGEVAPVMLWGAPGVGKSSIVAGLCEELDIELIDIRLAQRDPVDIRGLPVPGDNGVEWMLSSDWPRDPESRGIILFDELTAVDRSLQVAVYELILDRRLGSLYQVPPGWLMVAAGNRGGDRAVATTMSSALANRFCHLEVAPELADWLGWAQQADIHPDVIGFLRFCPECFHDMRGDLERGWPSARSWERVSHLVERDRLDDDTLELMIGGLVGVGAGRQFMAFREVAAQLPDVERLLHHPDEFKLPKKADQRYALCAALVHHLWRGSEESLEQRVEGFLEIGLELPSDFAAMAMTDALGNRAHRGRRIDRLIGHSLMKDWRERHGQAFELERKAA